MEEVLLSSVEYTQC